MSQDNIQEETTNNVGPTDSGSLIETHSPDSVTEQWPCEFSGCCKVFSKRFMRNKHHQIHDPKHNCPYCPMKFPVKRDKTRHIRDRHSSQAGLPPVIPNYCPVATCNRNADSGRPFGRRDNMLRHVRKQHARDREALAAAMAAGSSPVSTPTQGEEEDDDDDYYDDFEV